MVLFIKKHAFLYEVSQLLDNIWPLGSAADWIAAPKSLRGGCTSSQHDHDFWMGSRTGGESWMHGLPDTEKQLKVRHHSQKAHPPMTPFKACKIQTVRRPVHLKGIGVRGHRACAIELAAGAAPAMTKFSILWQAHAFQILNRNAGILECTKH